LLVDHVSQLAQMIPFALLIINAVLIGIVAFRPNARALRVFQGWSWLVAFGGVAGVGFHLWGNWQIIREVAPDSSGLELLTSVLKSGNPALAPGLFVQIALLGWMYTFRHPSLVNPSR
jgi:hypothetical protein